MSGFLLLVLCISVTATLLVWQFSLNKGAEKTQIQFDQQADIAIKLFQEQMQRYADVLHAGVGFVAGSDRVDPGEWRSFTQNLGLVDEFPAISGLGIAYRVEHDELAEFVREQQLDRKEFTIRPAITVDEPYFLPYALPLTQIAPSRLERRAPGLDLAREARRSEAIKSAVVSGEVRITAPIRPTRSEEPGFILVAPIYRTYRPGSIAQREEQLVGAVVGSVVTRHLAQGILDSSNRQVTLKVSDGGELIYNEHTAENTEIDTEPLRSDTRVVPFFGRDWQFDIGSTRSFRAAHRNLEPTIILIGGLFIDGLLLYLFSHLSRSKQRALAYGNMISDRYERQSEELQKSHCELEERNEKLQSFSYVVSHDLKAPLRGVAFLAECIEEDMDELHPDVDLHPDITAHVQGIGQQVTFANNMITGILSYSGLGTDPEEPERVDMSELLCSMRITLSVSESQLPLVSDFATFPTLNTYRTQLYQVFLNLIGNGFKYHHGEGEAKVTVRVVDSDLPDFYRFTVKDNGPGIASEHHDKIFDVFATLQPKNHSMSSGVGLAIVKKLVVQHGGRIQVSSSQGQGTEFAFDWPKHVEQLPDACESGLFRKAA